MDNINDKIDQYKILKNKIDELNQELDVIKNEIIEYMNGEEILKTDKYTVKYTMISSKRFDTSNFKKEMPDIYDKYILENQSKRFTII